MTVETNPHWTGYARVSTRDQNPDSQDAALRAAGCERIFIDHGESAGSPTAPSGPPASRSSAAAIPSSSSPLTESPAPNSWASKSSATSATAASGSSL